MNARATSDAEARMYARIAYVAVRAVSCVVRLAGIFFRRMGYRASAVSATTVIDAGLVMRRFI